MDNLEQIIWKRNRKYEAYWAVERERVLTNS